MVGKRYPGILPMYAGKFVNLSARIKGGLYENSSG
jgi:hypothetical protein